MFDIFGSLVLMMLVGCNRRSPLHTIHNSARCILVHPAVTLLEIVKFDGGALCHTGLIEMAKRNNFETAQQSFSAKRKKAAAYECCSI